MAQVNANYTTAYNNYLSQMQARNSFFKGIGQLGGMAGTALLMNPATRTQGAAVLGGTGLVGMLS